MSGPSTSEFTEVEPEPFQLPEPEVRATPMLDEELPRGVRTVVNLLRKHGWEVQVTYARGPWQMANRAAYTIKQNILILAYDEKAGYNTRGHHRTWNRSLRASWISPAGEDAWKFNAAHLAGFRGLRSSTDLKKYIKGEEVEI